MTNLRGLSAVLLVLAVSAAVGFLAFSSSNKKAENTSSSTVQSEEEEVTQEAYTKAQIAQHDNRSDCWTYIGKNVYDLTSYVARHPGGSEILLACGNDGTDLFKSRESSSGQEIGSGKPHSSNAEFILKSLKVGTLSH